MNGLKLKTILRSRDVLPLIRDLADETSLCVRDADGLLLLGDGDLPEGERCLIQVGEEVIGRVGGERAESVAALLRYLVSREYEKKCLARETLDTYKEMTFLYGISEKLAACLEPEDVASLAVLEAERYIEADYSGVLYMGDSGERLRNLTARMDGEWCDDFSSMFAGVSDRVNLSGGAEIVNDLGTSSEGGYSSLMCAPLKCENETLGIFCVKSRKPANYAARDLKLLMALASQTANALQNAISHSERLRVERIRHNLERYVASQVVDAIISSRDDISLDPAKRHISVLFSDIRNFTARCEELDPEDLVGYLNEYFTHMVDVIFDHSGTVNKFVGDMIVALFGAPASIEHSECRAVEAAIDMQRRIRSIPVSFIRDKFITGIGVNSGEIIVGNVGSPRHMDYTAVGDEVNTAARLQALARGGEILVTRNVYEATRDCFEFKFQGAIQVKGKRNSVEVFEVLY